MTIRDLLDNGIEIQGALRICSWDDNEDDYTMYYESTDSEHTLNGDYLDKEITYMYTTDTYKSIEEDRIEVPILVIEVAESED